MGSYKGKLKCLILSTDNKGYTGKLYSCLFLNNYSSWILTNLAWACLGLQWSPYEVGGRGPLVGILSNLHKSPSPRVLEALDVDTIRLVAYAFPRARSSVYNDN